MGVGCDSSSFYLALKKFWKVLRTDSDSKTLTVSQTCKRRQACNNSAVTWPCLSVVCFHPLRVFHWVRAAKPLHQRTLRRGNPPESSPSTALSASLHHTWHMGMGSCTGITELHHTAYVFNQNNSYFKY